MPVNFWTPSREAFLLAVKTHRSTLQTSSKGPPEYLVTLDKVGLSQTAKRLGALLDVR